MLSNETTGNSAFIWFAMHVYILIFPDSVTDYWLLFLFKFILKAEKKKWR